LIPADTLPSLEERFRQAELARDVLCSRGYAAIGLDHFARPQDSLAQAAACGALHRNFQGYTTDAAPALLGLGASAIGSLPQGYVQNAPSVPAYRAAIEAGRLPTARGVAITDTDRMRREVIERLMCDLAVDLDAVAARYGKSRAVFADALLALWELVRDGIVALDGGKVTIDPRWRPAVRLVCASFDEYLPQNSVRHSVAV
jgi:oxygen-independent coproporphyrinogen-3 oxidase